MDRKRAFEIAYILLLPIVMISFVWFTPVVFWVKVYLTIATIAIAAFLITLSKDVSRKCEIGTCDRDAVKLERFCRPCRIKVLALRENVANEP